LRPYNVVCSFSFLVSCGESLTCDAQTILTAMSSAEFSN
jgi:hypothetical protein